MSKHTVADTAQLNEQLNHARQALDSGDLQQALQLFTELNKRAPERGNINFYFGSALLAVEEFDAAIKHLSQACHALPEQYAPLFTLADTFAAVNSIDDVETVINFSLSRFPKEPAVLYRSATVYRELGQLSRADELASLCITHSNDMLLSAYAWLLKLNLGQMPDIAEAHKALVAIGKAMPYKQTDNARLKMIMQFALGRYFELRKDHDEAFEHWRTANALQLSMCDYRVEDLRPLFAAIKVNTYQLPANASEPSTFTPIFILGLPRTGSTLLEQTLCRHSDVESLGEQAIIGGYIANFMQHHTQQTYPLFMSELSSPAGQALCSQAAAQYEKAVRRRQLNTPFVIDKLPANFQSIGLILALFPHAKIIHLSRDFADTALSIFKNHFAVNEPYMCDLSELSCYHSMYKDLMQHWHDIYPGKILELRYESLVSDPQASIKKVLSYCGLTPQKVCWEKEQPSENATRRMVKTLSSTQVIEPIHQRSVGRHSDYASLLHSNGLIIYQSR